MASEKGHIDVVRLLAASGADVNSVQTGAMVPYICYILYIIAILWTGEMVPAFSASECGAGLVTRVRTRDVHSGGGAEVNGA